MKKQMAFCVTIVTLFCSCFLSCNGGDNDHNNGSDNTTDVAVTGDVSKIGVTYAIIEGYVNLNQITATYNSQQIGIEISSDEDFKSAKLVKTNELVGNKISVIFYNLNGDTKYYYRTIVKINSLSYYGEKRSFITSNFSNLVSISEAYEITEESAIIKSEIDLSKIDKNNTFHIGLVYSKTKTALHPDSILKNQGEQYLKFYNLDNYLSNNENKTIENKLTGLKSGTTYYYCSYTFAGYKIVTSEIKYFTTRGVPSDDDDDDNGSIVDNIVKLTPPPYKDLAKVLNIIQDNSAGVKQLRFMESGAFMITRQEGSDGLVYEFGKFTYSNGKYVFDNGMTITIEPSGSNYDITITWQNGTTIKTTGTIDTSSSVSAGVYTDNLCSRPWKVEQVIVSAVFEGKTIGREFKGPVDLVEVKAWYEYNFGKLKDQIDANTIIEGIYFDSKGLFAINYKNRKDDVGVWRWTNMNNGELVYNWNDKMQAISLFTGNASVEFTKNPESCKLILKGTVNGIDFEFAFILK